MPEIFMESPLGVIKIREEHERLSAILFIDDPQVSFEANNSEPGSTLLQAAKTQLQQYFQGKLNQFPLLDFAEQPGTEFQKRVWDELTKIPFGKTISYREMAIRLGDEKCIRAAASANGQNNLAIAVPCHRVIGTDGSLTGYAGGLWRKKWLLEHEAKWSGGATQGTLGF